MPFPQNAYPNPENFSEVSFPEGVTPPSVEPDEGDTILVAYNPEWSKVLAAACDQLRQYETWIGTHDEKVTAVERATDLKILLQTPFEVPERDYPAPYWDDDEDVSEEQPIESQTWYGQVSTPDAPPDELTFVENAVIWLFAGFVAIVASPALPAGIAAALAFRTLAVRFTLAFNRGDLREQFRVIIDAKDYGNIDTGDMSVGDQVEMNVDGLDEADFHDILIVRTLPE